MIRAEQQHDWLKKIIVQSESVQIKNKPDWFHQSRSKAKRVVMSMPVLNRKQEAWRYSQVDKLFKQNFKLITENSNDQQININDWAITGFDSLRLVFVNGQFIGAMSAVLDVPDNVSIGGLHAAIELDPKQIISWFSDKHEATDQLFSAMNTACLNDGAIINIGDHVEVDKPIEVIYLNTSDLSQFDAVDSDGVMAQTRNIISLGIGSKVTLVERFIGVEQGKYFHNNLSDVLLAEGAILKHYRVQDESRDAYHLSNLQVSQQKNSRYVGTYIAFGAGWSKTDISVSFKAEEAECILKGLYVVGDEQLTDYHLNVKHNVPACTSREHFKGILYGKGRAVFDGHILVEKQAQHSDAQLTNNNLMLTRDAEVDTKPQLEIYANDVKCGHGTTVGQIDAQQLFYMRSRGLSETMANKLICLGFAGDIIDSIDEKILSDHVAEKLVNALNEKVFLSEVS